jgi:hypothetical protein
VRLTVPQRFDFGDAVAGGAVSRAAVWDSLRLGGSNPFALAPSRDELDRRAASDPLLRERARDVARAAERLGARRLASYGVGVGGLEALLEREGVEVTLTEYAPRTVERLRVLFPEARIELHDLIVDGPLGDVDVHLFHRIDTELSDEQWHVVFRRFTGVPVIFVAAGLATPRSLARQVLLRLRRRGTPTGWIRTRDSLRALWAETHEAHHTPFAELPGWVLLP